MKTLQHSLAVRTRSHSTALGLTLFAACLTLAACDKPGQTAGQQVDRAIAATGRAASEAQADAKEVLAGARAGTAKAAEAVAATASDVAITAKIKAELAADPNLSMLRVDVDTRGGKVALSGTAPTANTRERATMLAKSVQGVESVDNRLQLEAVKGN